MATTPTPKKGVITSQDGDTQVTDNKQTQAQSSVDLTALIERINKLEAEKEALAAAVGQDEFYRHLAGKEQDKRAQVRLQYIYDKDGNEKIITGWSKLLVDNVYVANGQVHETQTVNVTFLDGTTQTMPYEQAFNHRNRTDWYRVNGVTTRADGRYFLLEIDGKEIEIHEKFIN